MKRLFIDWNCVVSPGTGENLQFAGGVIHNLYRINQQLQIELFLVLREENLRQTDRNALQILRGENIIFGIAEEPTGVSNASVVSRTDDGFEITQNDIVMKAENWDDICDHLRSSIRKALHTRNTNETKILVEINIDGSGKYNISTGLGFFDHMLEQLSKHSSIDLSLSVAGDLHIDEHHTIEDTAIALGETFSKALGNKAGMERYGFLLPMDDCLAQVAIDFGGRNWLVWDVTFSREYVGDVPTEMFYHFFKSFSDAARCNLNIKAEGTNEHHKIESIFKAFARAVKMAVAVNYESRALPTTKGIL
jgi:imidazoleglycerol-phosphate dehydratase/histidinol-phosphatase